jgi:hypothetical protein
VKEGSAGSPASIPRPALFLFFAFLAVLAVRVGIAAQFQGNYDSESFRLAAELTLSGKNVYAETERYNYSPVWAYVVAALWKLARPEFSRFLLLLGLLQTAADVVSAVLVARIARRLGRTPGEASRAALLFFSNPVSVLASSAHGQFDGLAIVFLLAAVLVALGGMEGRRAAGVTALLSASLLVKHVTAFHPLLFWRRVRRPGLPDLAIAAPYAALALSFLPFASAAGAIWDHVVVYGTRGAKPAALLAFLEMPEHGRLVLMGLFAGAVLWALREGRELELPRAALLLWLAILTFLPSFGMQYLVWPLALGSLYPTAALGLYTFAGAVYHSSWSLDLEWPVRVSSLGTWLACAFWLATETARLRRERRMPRRFIASSGDRTA